MRITTVHVSSPAWFSCATPCNFLPTRKVGGCILTSDSSE
nr:MAG TPA: hypothetical protein [Caudoviricetes sp.]DAU40688.1 MAG TPA: hypothetical protein [Caudoviricetes sp.]